VGARGGRARQAAQEQGAAGQGGGGRGPVRAQRGCRRPAGRDGREAARPSQEAACSWLGRRRSLAAWSPRERTDTEAEGRAAWGAVCGAACGEPREHLGRSQVPVHAREHVGMSLCLVQACMSELSGARLWQAVPGCGEVAGGVQIGPPGPRAAAGAATRTGWPCTSLPGCGGVAGVVQEGRARPQAQRRGPAGRAQAGARRDRQRGGVRGQGPARGAPLHAAPPAPRPPSAPWPSRADSLGALGRCFPRRRHERVTPARRSSAQGARKAQKRGTAPAAPCASAEGVLPRRGRRMQPDHRARTACPSRGENGRGALPERAWLVTRSRMLSGCCPVRDP